MNTTLQLTQVTNFKSDEICFLAFGKMPNGDDAIAFSKANIGANAVLLKSMGKYTWNNNQVTVVSRPGIIDAFTYYLETLDSIINAVSLINCYSNQREYNLNDATPEIMQILKDDSSVYDESPIGSDLSHKRHHFNLDGDMSNIILKQSTSDILTTIQDMTESGELTNKPVEFGVHKFRYEKKISA